MVSGAVLRANGRGSEILFSFSFFISFYFGFLLPRERDVGDVRERRGVVFLLFLFSSGLLSSVSLHPSLCPFHFL